MVSVETAFWVVLVQSLFAYVAIREALDNWRTKAVLGSVFLGCTIVLFGVYMWVRIGWSWWLPLWVVVYLCVYGALEDADSKIRKVPKVGM